MDKINFREHYTPVLKTIFQVPKASVMILSEDGKSFHSGAGPIGGSWSLQWVSVVWGIMLHLCSFSVSHLLSPMR